MSRGQLTHQQRSTIKPSGAEVTSASALTSSARSSIWRDPWMYGLSAFFAAAILLWFAFDHGYPYWDAASHVKSSIQYAELFRHPAFWQPSWIHQFLTVNPAYPLVIHAFNGLLMTIFGPGRLVDALSLSFFSLIMSASVYGIATKTLNERKAAILAVTLINCYPLVSELEHLPMLDFPHLSLHCLAIVCLINWWHKHSWQHTIGAAVALAVAALTKQTAILFLAGPGIVLLISQLLKNKTSQIAQLSIVGATTAAALASWIVPNLTALRLHRIYTAPVGIETSTALQPLSNLATYLLSLTFMLTPSLCLLLLVGLVTCLIYRDFLVRLWIPCAASAVGLALTCLLPSINPETRYIIPVVLPVALLTAASVVRLGSTTAIIALIALAFAQFVSLNYCPYPLAAPPELLSSVRTFMGQNLRVQALAPSLNPTPGGDAWGQEWVIDTIAEAQKGRPCSLNVMPSTPQLSVHTLELISLYHHAHIRPSTLRFFTNQGDILKDSLKSVQYFDWFLLKTGFQGYRLKNKSSEAEYEAVLHYVKTSGQFQLTAERLIADGSTLQLYRQRQGH